MIEWQSIWALLFLIPLILIIIYNQLNKRQRRATFKYSYLKTFKQISKSLRSYLVGLPNILKIAAIILAIVALARPQRSDTKIKRNVEGIDIMIALDISDSMLIEDMKPVNRLEASKKTIKEFIEKRISDKIGLIVFSGESFTKVPLTLDYPLLLKTLSEITTTRTIKMGTAIGVALANSAGRLKESVAKSQVVVFLTDGENNSGTIDPETALEIAKGSELKYTLLEWVKMVRHRSQSPTRICVVKKENVIDRFTVKSTKSFWSKWQKLPVGNTTVLSLRAVLKMCLTILMFLRKLKLK